MSFVEKPPILSGTIDQQLRAMRDYLWRMASSMETAAAAPAALVISGNNAAADVKTMEAVKKNAQELRALILKSADEVTQVIESNDETYRSLFLANSAFGSYQQLVTSQLNEKASAGSVQDAFSRIEQVSTNVGNLDREVQEYYTQVDGQIRRGFVSEPGSSTVELGIAISQNLQFGSGTRTSGGNVYYELTSGQTFGLYTSTGWQFWIDGYKAGWFNSSDGMLHVRRVVAEDALQISGKWQIRVAGGAGRELEFVYIGG